jgi:hypothetical protein
LNAIILLPTYQRPELLKTFLKSYIETETTTECWVLVDKDDPKKEEYLKIEYPKGVTLTLTVGRSMAAKIRDVWDKIINLDAVCILNDDHELITKHWDQKCLSQIKGYNVLGTNDNYVAPQRLAGATWWSGKVLRTIGYIFPPGIEHLYVDSVWEYLTSKAQCANILMDVVVAHNHAFKDQSKPKDETHNSIYTSDWNDAAKEGTPAWHFKNWMEKDAEKDAQKLLEIQPKMGLMVSTPCHDSQVYVGYALGLADLSIFFTQQNVYFEMARVAGSSLLPHARNSLVDMFLKSRCQKMLFVDADQGFQKEHVLHLFNSNKRIVGGITPHKRFPINFNFEPLEQDKHYFKDLVNKGPEEFVKYAMAKADPKGEIEVNRVGTGFLMIDRSVFEIMKEYFQKEEQRIKDFVIKIKTLLPELSLEYDDIIRGYLNQEFGYEAFDNNPSVIHHEYFKFGTIDLGGGHRRYAGEDWWFNALAKKLHIPLFINAHSSIEHHGNFVFSGGIRST